MPWLSGQHAAMIPRGSWWDQRPPRRRVAREAGLRCVLALTSEHARAGTPLRQARRRSVGRRSAGG